jgi:hypothetical protein
MDFTNQIVVHEAFSVVTDSSVTKKHPRLSHQKPAVGTKLS